MSGMECLENNVWSESMYPKTLISKADHNFPRTFPKLPENCILLAPTVLGLQLKLKGYLKKTSLKLNVVDDNK